MSLSRYPFDKKEKVLVVDPRINFNNQAYYAINAAGQRVQYKNFPSQNYSGTEIQINTTQSKDTAIDSRIYVIVEFELTFSGTPNPGERLVQLGSNDAARFMPLTSVTKTLNLELNEETFTVPINAYHDALMHYNNSIEEMGYSMSQCPSFLDSYQNYADQALYGSAMNPLGQHGENSRTAPLRGGFIYRVVSGNGLGETSAVIRFQTCEPMLISPLSWHANYAPKALIGISALNITLILESDLRRVWSHSSLGVPDLAIDNVRVVGSPSAVFCYIIPKKSIPIPQIQRYPYFIVNKTSKIMNAGSPLAPNDSIAKFTSDSLPLYGVPKRVYIFARRSDATRTFNTTDTYARIDQLNISFHGMDGVFSGAPIQQLYQVSVSNGYKGSFEAFSFYEGSIFCCDFGKDYPLMTDEAVGTNENVQFQYEISITNTNQTESTVFQLMTIIIYEGVMTIDGMGNITRESNIVSALDAIDTIGVQRLEMVDSDYYSAGSFSSRLKKAADVSYDAAKKLYKMGKENYEKIPEPVRKVGVGAAKGALGVLSPRIAKIVDIAGPMAAQAAEKYLGSGYTEDQVYGLLLKDMKAGKFSGPKKAKSSKAITGGAKLSQAELKKLMKN